MCVCVCDLSSAHTLLGEELHITGGQCRSFGVAPTKVCRCKVMFVDAYRFAAEDDHLAVASVVLRLAKQKAVFSDKINSAVTKLPLVLAAANARKLATAKAAYDVTPQVFSSAASDIWHCKNGRQFRCCKNCFLLLLFCRIAVLFVFLLEN